MYPEQRVGACKTLWMGAIQHYWDESYLSHLFSETHAVEKVKVIRSPSTRLPVGYAFIEFETPEVARSALELFNGQLIPGTNLSFRLNWGKAGNATSSKNNSRELNSLFVGDLAAEVTDEMLYAAFSPKYSSCVNAKVIVDPTTRVSKGYGFVKFSSKAECSKALVEMKGFKIGSRTIRTGSAQPRPPGTFKRSSRQLNAYPPNPYGMRPASTMGAPFAGALAPYNTPISSTLPVIGFPGSSYMPQQSQHWQQQAYLTALQQQKMAQHGVATFSSVYPAPTSPTGIPVGNAGYPPFGGPPVRHVPNGSQNGTQNETPNGTNEGETSLQSTSNWEQPSSEIPDQPEPENENAGIAQTLGNSSIENTNREYIKQALEQQDKGFYHSPAENPNAWEASQQAIEDPETY